MDINDGVQVNVAPLQVAGLLASDVLNKKDMPKAIAGRTGAAVTSAVAISPGLDAISLTQPAQFTDLALELMRELPGSSRVAGLSASALSGSAELGIAFDGRAVQLARASGSMSYRLRLVQPGANAGYFASAPITLAPDEAHCLTPASWNGLGAGTVTLQNTARSVFLSLVLSIRQVCRWPVGAQYARRLALTCMWK